MIMPESLSIHAVDARLRRHPKTIRRWCTELDITITYRPSHVGLAGYLSYADFERLREYSHTQPKRTQSQKRARRARAAATKPNLVMQELARRIEAASRWKREHRGAYIGTCEWEMIEHQMKTGQGS